MFLVNRSNSDLLKASPSQSPDWVVYADSKNGIEIEYPKTWNYRLKDNPWDSFIVFFPIDDEQLRARVAISVELLSELITLKDYIESFKKEVSDYHEGSRFIEQKEVLLLHNKAYKVLYAFERDHKKIKKMAIITIQSKKAYIIHYEAEFNSFLKYESVVKSMANSLELTNP